MHVNSEHHIGNVSHAGYSVTNPSGEWMKRAFINAGTTSPLPGYPMPRDQKSLDLIKVYLQGVRYLARNKQRRSISQELG